MICQDFCFLTWEILITSYDNGMSNSLKKLQQHIIFDLDVMQKLFGDYPMTELLYDTPFQLLMSVVMSAQTTDKQVNKVTEKFYDRIRNPQDVIAISEEEFYEYIKGVNYAPTKARNLYKTAIILATSQQPLATSYKIPETLSELIKLPWVGIKTAKVILYVLYNQKYIAVDTHVHRVAHRLWRVKDMSPEKTSDALEKLIPDDYKDRAHHVIIYFGRYLCKSQKPECERCPLQEHCLYYKAKNG
jgi:endonuclease III